MTVATPDVVVAEVLQKFDALGLQYAVGGSFASSVWGNPRQTNDLDVVLDLPERLVDGLVAAFQDAYNISNQEIRGALASSDEYRGFQLLHFESVFKIDVFLLNASPFNVSEFSRRTMAELGNGVQAPCFSPEDTVLRKLLWYELGNRVSDRQWNDIVNVLEVQAGILDTTYMAHWAAALGVTDLLQEAMQEASVVDS
jgi:hypothetical protein